MAQAKSYKEANQATQSSLTIQVRGSCFEVGRNRPTKKWLTQRVMAV